MEGYYYRAQREAFIRTLEDQLPGRLGGKDLTEVADALVEANIAFIRAARDGELVEIATSAGPVVIPDPEASLYGIRPHRRRTEAEAAQARKLNLDAPNLAEWPRSDDA